MTVRRSILALALALAAANGALAGSGLAVPPHPHAPGAPATHDHLLAAYRYPLFLLGLPAAMVAPSAGAQWSLGLPAGAAAAALVFATLTAIVPRLRRPALRQVAVFAIPALIPPVWRAALILAPPRVPALLFA